MRLASCFFVRAACAVALPDPALAEAEALPAAIAVGAAANATTRHVARQASVSFRA
jgi:hypothetical protein